MRAGGLAGIVLVLIAWTLVTTTGVIDRLFLPPPWTVIAEFRRLVSNGELLRDTWKTMERTFQGFLGGAVLGILVGVAMGSYRRVYQTLEFPLDFFRSIPATALFPLFIVIFGLGSEVKVFVAFWATSMVVAINTLYGVRSVATARLEVAQLKRVPHLRRFFLLIIPSAAPYILAGCRIALSLALVVEIVAEMFLGSDSGLGRRIYNASTIFDMEGAYAAVLAVGILGYALNRGLVELERAVVEWKN